jgi:hypothetical protein
MNKIENAKVYDFGKELFDYSLSTKIKESEKQNEQFKSQYSGIIMKKLPQSIQDIFNSEYSTDKFQKDCCMKYAAVSKDFYSEETVNVDTFVKCIYAVIFNSLANKDYETDNGKGIDFKKLLDLVMNTKK